METVASPRPHAFALDELRRYGRQIILPGIGTEGQARLARARVLLVGAGGLGSPIALYLAAAGVGHVGVVDHDRVELSNLHRQPLHGTSDLGEPKVESARRRLAEVNPHVLVTTHEVRLAAANALEIVGAYDVVVDGSDNFPTRYLVSDACVLLGKVNVYGSVHRFEGQASIFGLGDGPCYRCLFREPPPAGLVPSCAEAGVFGVLPGLVGMVQAAETLKFLLGVGDSLSGRLLLIDALGMHFRTIEVRRDPDCPACGTRSITELVDYDAPCGTLQVHDEPDAVRTVSPADLASRRRANGEFILLDVREPAEYAIARVDGSRLVPLGALERAMSSLDPDAEIIVMCLHGVRSLGAAESLRAAGFHRVAHLAGGIDRWSIEIDPSVPRY